MMEIYHEEEFQHRPGTTAYLQFKDVERELEHIKREIFLLKMRLKNVDEKT